MTCTPLGVLSLCSDGHTTGSHNMPWRNKMAQNPFDCTSIMLCYALQKGVTKELCHVARSSHLFSWGQHRSLMEVLTK